MLWTAPELLRNPVSGGSFAGDVFSFSIIIQEVISRTLPYAMMDMPAHGEGGCLISCVSYKPPVSYHMSVSQRSWSVWSSLLLSAGRSFRSMKLLPSVSRWWMNVGMKTRVRGRALMTFSNRWAESHCCHLLPSTGSGLFSDFISTPSTICLQFRGISRGRRANIIDSMLRMLEQYSSNLEDLIRERTDELEIERTKTDKLVGQLLPK